MQNFTQYILALVTILSVPGPTNALLAAAGATTAVSRWLRLLIWGLTAYTTAILIERAVLVSAVERLPGLIRWLDAAAALYLIGLSVVLWRSRFLIGTRTVHAHQLFTTTLLNPKALIIAGVLIPIVPAGGATPWTWALLPYGLALVVLAPLSGVLWLLAGRALSRAVPYRLDVLVPRATSVTLGVFAAVLIVLIRR